MSRPTWARWVTRISLVVALVALVWTIRQVGLAAIAKYFKLIGWWWFAVVALEIVITSLDALAIRAFMSPEQDKIRWRSALLSQLAGRSVNAVTPSGNVGEAIKVSVLTDYVSQSRAVATILLYNVVSFSVELATVAVAAPIMVLLLPMPASLRWVFLIAGAVCAILSLGLYVLVHRGMLESFGRLGTRIRIPGLGLFRRRVLKRAGATSRLIQDYTKLQGTLRGVDDKMRMSAGARKRDRITGIVAVVLSRLTSMTLSLVILHAIGESITVAFIAGYTVGGFVVYMLASLVPMGLGISEGGNWWLFRALGENPARGTALVIARRVTLVMYAAIGLVLVTASETVRRARDRHQTAPAKSPEPARQVVATPLPVAVAKPVAPTPVDAAAE
jgi:uncharacterized protein (TIRG00374 family)